MKKVLILIALSFLFCLPVLAGQVVNTGTITITSLLNCAALYTDASGNISCGTVGPGGSLAGLSDIQTPLSYAVGKVLIGNGTKYESGNLTASQVGAVANTGNETISGIKTFASIPILPATTPTLGTQAVNKTYVDTFVSQSIFWLQPVITISSTTPPVSPSVGDRYLVPAGATGAWTNKKDLIADWTGSWTFTPTSTGIAILALDTLKNFVYNGTQWVQFNQTTAYTADNGININGSNLELGGSLTTSTIIDLGAYDQIFNLGGIGSFKLTNGSTNYLSVNSSGASFSGTVNVDGLSVTNSESIINGNLNFGNSTIYQIKSTGNIGGSATPWVGAYITSISSTNVTTTNLYISATATAKCFSTNGTTCITGGGGSSSSTYITLVTTTASYYNGNITNGALVGYQAVNSLCNASFSGSHICTDADINSYIANGGSIAGWGSDVNTFWEMKGAPGYTANAGDCLGWTSNNSSYLGPFWIENSNGGGHGMMTNCSVLKQIGCCR